MPIKNYSTELYKISTGQHTKLEDSEKDYDDPLVKRLQKSVKRIKSDREMGARYMLLEEMMRDEFNAGKHEEKIELISEFLSEHGTIPKTIEDKLANISDENKLRVLVKKAATASGIEEFELELDKMFTSE